MEHTEKFEELKNKYDKNFITKATLKKWVVINQKRPGSGISENEYEEITGEKYADNN